MWKAVLPGSDEPIDPLRVFEDLLLRESLPLAERPIKGLRTMLSLINLLWDQYTVGDMAPI